MHFNFETHPDFQNIKNEKSHILELRKCCVFPKVVIL